MTEPRLLLAASQLGWVTHLTHWVAEHGRARIVGQALTEADTRTVEFDVLVADSWSTLLSRRLVTEIQASGATVLALTDSTVRDGQRLADLGVALSLPMHVTPEEIVGRAAEHAAVRPHMPTRPAPPDDRPAEQTGQTGTCAAVLGDRGTVDLAVHLAVEAARAGSTVLVDFDTLHPRVAARLGTPLVPNLYSVYDDLRSETFDPVDLPTRSGIGVIAGISDTRDWDLFTGSHTDSLIDGLTCNGATVVAVIDRNLEDLAPMTGLHARFDVARTVIRRSDHIVVAANACPIGLIDTVNTAADIKALTEAPLHVVAETPHRSSFGATEWRTELERHITATSIDVVRSDVDQATAAWNGSVNRRSRYARDVRRLVGRLFVELEVSA